MSLAFLEYEEQFGRFWHRLVGDQTSYPRFPDAAVSLEVERRRLAVLFRGLGGDPALELAAGTARTSNHRLRLRQKLGMSEERLARAERTGELVLLRRPRLPADARAEPRPVRLADRLSRRGRARRGHERPAAPGRGSTSGGRSSHRPGAGGVSRPPGCAPRPAGRRPAGAAAGPPFAPRRGRGRGRGAAAARHRRCTARHPRPHRAARAVHRPARLPPVPALPLVGRGAPRQHQPGRGARRERGGDATAEDEERLKRRAKRRDPEDGEPGTR